MRYVNDATLQVGRDPKEVKICVAAPAYVGDNLPHQRDQCRWFGGMVGNHVADLVARYGEGGEAPTALTDYIKARQGEAVDTSTSHIRFRCVVRSPETMVVEQKRTNE